MQTIGLACGFARALPGQGGEFPLSFGHDSAACLVRDGRIVAAVEEERFTRVKHSNVFAEQALRFCLDEGDTSLEDVAAIGYYYGEQENDADLKLMAAESSQAKSSNSRDLLHNCLVGSISGYAGTPSDLRFIRHHLCHGFAAYCNSGFDSSVVLVADGKGDAESFTVAAASPTEYEIVRSFSDTQSLGRLYRDVIRAIGYDSFDEYKVMGLAPYGDPARYRRLLRQLYSLEEDGRYSLDYRDALAHILRSGFNTRSADGVIESWHADLAASLQEAVEAIYMHVADWARKALGISDLCTGGGVSLNAKLNGKLAATGMFKRIYFDPAAHDAGAAVGAALFLNYELDPQGFRRQPLTSVYFGPDLQREVRATGRTVPSGARVNLAKWSDFVRVVSDSGYEEVPDRLAAGAVVGVANGRSEFGPRALGNRSILADPRPIENRTRINDVIKERESYRPFAPAVVGTEIHKYFEVPRSVLNLDFMITVVPVRPEFRSVLGAVTHVDGTARPQSVWHSSNPVFCRLLERFGELAEFPILLNTSFNRACEPIVQSVDDVVETFLATKLDYLVLDGVLYERAIPSVELDDLGLRCTVPRDLHLETRALADGSGLQYRVARNFGRGRVTVVSAELWELLRDLSGSSNGGEYPQSLSSEVDRMWMDGFIHLKPQSHQFSRE